jgi:hypothetical protein
MAQEIDQATNKGDCCQAKRDPTKTLTATSFGMGYELVKVKDRTDGCGYADNYRQNVFQAFHFEPPAEKLNMKVKEKAAFLSRYNGSMLTPRRAALQASSRAIRISHERH